MALFFESDLHRNVVLPRLSRSPASPSCDLFAVWASYDDWSMFHIKRHREESTSPTKLDSNLDSNVCITFEKLVSNGDSLECVWCEQLQHRNCAKLSDDQYCILKNLPTNVVYFCFHKLSSALAAADIIDEVNSTIRNTLKYFELTLTNKFDRISKFKESSKQHQVTLSNFSDKFGALAKDITSNNTQLVTLKSQLDKLQKQSYAAAVQGSNPTTNQETGTNHSSINLAPPATSQDALRNAVPSVINEEKEAKT